MTKLSEIIKDLKSFASTLFGRWTLALFIISVALGLILSYFWSGLFLLIAGLYCSPPSLSQIAYIFRNHFTRVIKIGIFYLLLTLSLASFIFTSYSRKPNQIKEASQLQIKSLISADENFIPINNPADSSVFQVKNYILKNLNEGEIYEPVSWSKIFVMGDKCWVSHRFVIITNKTQKTSFYQNFWMDSQGEVETVEDIEK